MSTKISFNQIDGNAVSVKDKGAVGQANTSDDDGAAIVAAFAQSQADRVSWSNTEFENPTSASKPEVFFPAGVYFTTEPLTGEIAYSFMNARGNTAIVADWPLRTVDHAFKFAYDWSMEGMEIRGFVDGILIDNNNVNQSHHYITNCHFHGQSQAAIHTQGTPGSGMVVVKNVTFSSRTVGGAKFYLSDDSSSRISYMAIKDSWIQPSFNASGTFGSNGAVIDAYATLGVLENLNCVPRSEGYSPSTSTPPHWVRNANGANLELKNCNFNPELVGGITVLDNFTEAKVNPDSRSTVAISNCRMSTPTDIPQIRLFKLPNVISISGIVDDGINGGVKYVDATDAEGIAESSGIDFDNLKNFAQDGSVMVDSWDYLISRQGTMGSHAGLGYQLAQAHYYDQVGVPYKGKIDVDDFLCSTDRARGSVSIGGSGTTATGDSIDYRGVAIRSRTATSDGASYSLDWSGFIDQTWVSGSPAGKDLTLTTLVEIDYQPAAQGSGELQVKVAGMAKRYPLRPGYNVYAIPSVYFNTTGAADADVDRLRIVAGELANGDEVIFGRIVVLRGFQQTDIDQLTTYQEGVTTPSDVANTYFDSTAGWVKGDRVLNHAASTEVPFYICSTEQTGVTAWASGATTS